MKKIIITSLTLIFAISLFGQTWLERRAEAYASAAQQTFNIDDEAKAKIAELWIARQQAFQEVGSKVQAEGLSQEERREMNQAVGRKYRDKIIEVLGISIPEFREFNEQN